MTFKYKIIERLTKIVLFETNNFDTAQEIVLSQDNSNSHKRLLIIKVAV